MNTLEGNTLPQTRKDAWWLWTGLHSDIKAECEMLIDSEYFQSLLPPLAPRAVLSYAQPVYTRLLLALRGDSGDYLMNVVFDPDLLAVRYGVDRDPHGHELLVVRRHKDSMLMSADGSLLTGDQAAKRIVLALTCRTQ